MKEHGTSEVGRGGLVVTSVSSQGSPASNWDRSSWGLKLPHAQDHFRAAGQAPGGLIKPRSNPESFEPNHPPVPLARALEQAEMP